MKRLYIVVEGQTEQEFVNSVIAPYLQNFGIYSVTPTLIHTSRTGKGGMANYQHLKNTINLQLVSKKDDFVVTTFIDFFRIPNNMPDYETCMGEGDKMKKVEMLEEAINKDIADKRFAAYIQLHEFEALLFADNRGFEYYYPKNITEQTAKIIEAYNNPEDINSSPQGAPSKRLLAINPDYNKVIEGNLVAMEIGIEKIIDKCPRFATWIEKITAMCR